MGQEGPGRDGKGRDGTGWDGTGRDGTGRDGTGRDPFNVLLYIALGKPRLRVRDFLQCYRFSSLRQLLFFFQVVL